MSEDSIKLQSLFVCIYDHEPLLDKFSLNSDWGTRENHRNVFILTSRFLVEWVHFYKKNSLHNNLDQARVNGAVAVTISIE